MGLVPGEGIEREIYGLIRFLKKYRKGQYWVLSENEEIL